MGLEKAFNSDAPQDDADTHGTRVLVLLRPESDRLEILAALKPLHNMDIQTFPRPKQLTMNMLTRGKIPRVLVLDADLSNPDDLKLIRELKSGDVMRIPVVVLADRGTDLAAIKAIRAGADDVLLKPVDPVEAREVFTRVLGTVPDDAVSPLGKAIVFMHLVGGAGATTLAVNTACMLAGATKEPDACLLDLDMQYGNAANLLDLPSNSPIKELIDDPARLDREMLENMMVKHDSGLRVLTAPTVPLPLSDFLPDTVATLMQIARGRFHYVVVDLPVALVPWTDAVLREASVVYIVCPPTVAAVHRFAQLGRLLQQEQLTNLPIRIVINRHQTPKKSGDISVSQFSSAIGRQVDHTLPNEYALVSVSHNEGRAAVLMKPQSKFAMALADMLDADLGHETFANKPRKRSFLGIGF